MSAPTEPSLWDKANPNPESDMFTRHLPYTLQLHSIPPGLPLSAGTRAEGGAAKNPLSWRM